MSRNKSVKICKWDEAIADAQAKLAATLQRAKKLKDAIQAFTDSKERGEPWPGTSATHN